MAKNERFSDFKAKTAKNDFTFFGLYRAALLFDAYNLKEMFLKINDILKKLPYKAKHKVFHWKTKSQRLGLVFFKTVNHAGALEAFNKLTTDQNFVEEMKIWLITQKEVSNWDTSRSTAEVIYTILNSGKSWTSANLIKPP